MRLNSNAHFDVEGALNGHRDPVSRGHRFVKRPMIDTQVAVKSWHGYDRAWTDDQKIWGAGNLSKA